MRILELVQIVERLRIPRAFGEEYALGAEQMKEDVLKAMRSVELTPEPQYEPLSALKRKFIVSKVRLRRKN